LLGMAKPVIHIPQQFHANNDSLTVLDLFRHRDRDISRLGQCLLFLWRVMVLAILISSDLSIRMIDILAAAAAAGRVVVKRVTRRNRIWLYSLSLSASSTINIPLSGLAAWFDQDARCFRVCQRKYCVQLQQSSCNSLEEATKSIGEIKFSSAWPQFQSLQSLVFLPKIGHVMVEFELRDLT
jgi:hypothetical protein